MRADLYKDLFKTEEYHWWHRAKRRLVLFCARTYLSRKKKQIILDVGCGTGRIMAELRSFGDVWGVDPSCDALQFCAQRGLVKVKKASAEHLPFSGEVFTAVFMMDVLEHVDEKEAMREVWRVLKKGGIFVFTVPAYMFLWSQWDVVLGHKKRYAAGEIKHMLEQNGFTSLKMSYMYSFLVIPVYFVRKIKSLFQKNKRYASDFRLGNNITNLIFGFISQLEERIIRMYDIPFGTSILCVAKK